MSIARWRRRAAPSKARGAPCAPPSAGSILLRLADLMKKHADEIAALESLDAGKPISAVLRQDLPAAIDTLTYYAGWADKISGEVVSDPRRCADLHRARAGRRRRRDRAVEFPADDRDVEARAGAGLRLHHRDEARRTDARCRRCGSANWRSRPACRRACSTSSPAPAGWSAKRWSIIPTSTRSPSPGSPGVGRGILRGAAGNFKRVSLELGGKSANVIFDDADLDAAVQGGGLRHLLQCRPGLLGRLARAGARERL